MTTSVRATTSFDLDPPEPDADALLPSSDGEPEVALARAGAPFPPIPDGPPYGPIDQAHHDDFARSLYQEAIAAAEYHIRAVKDLSPFTDPEPAWRTHFTAKYGKAWYDRFLVVILHGAALDLGERQAKAKTNGADESAVERLGIRPLADISHEAPDPLLIDRIVPEGHTILYGTGGVGKGVTTAYWLTKLIAGGHRVLIIDFENNPTEWSRRVWGFAGAIPNDRLYILCPNAAESQVKGAIWDLAEHIKEAAAQLEITYIVIDSIVMACTGTDTGSGATDAPTLYSAALQSIGLPALSLAHVTKDKGLQYPFGSIFWHNTARFTWSLEASGDGESTTLKNRKHNNYERQPNIVQTVTWLNGIPRDMLEKPEHVLIADLIEEILETPGQTVKAITAALNEDLPDGAAKYTPETVRKVLNRGLKAAQKRFTVDDQHNWSRAEE